LQEDSDDDSDSSASSEEEEKAAAVKADSDDDEEDSEDDSASGSGSDSSDSDEEEEEEAPSKKRKAEAEPVESAKKVKTETPAEGQKNLFVGSLSWAIDDEWLYREFEEFGELAAARVLTDRDTGRSKGFGYVEFNKHENAAAALAAKKGAEIDGRVINLDFATPRDNAAPKARANDRASKFGDTKNPPSDTLFLGNLSFEADENTVGEAFGVHGTVQNVRLPTDQYVFPFPFNSHTLTSLQRNW
jgi:nucleolin